MSLSFCCLASGSTGNATLVWSERTMILLDAGLSAREITRRCDSIGVDLTRIQGICISHEHSDHVTGLRVLERKYRVPIYANGGTRDILIRDDAELAKPAWRIFTTGQPFAIGDLTIEPFSIPHDAAEPVAFSISCGPARIAVVTDLGMPTGLIRDRIRSCDALVLESNHDEQMLQNSGRPWTLKQRILGRQGHLSNRSAAQLLCEVASPQLRKVYLAHLSQDCNRHDLALETSTRALGALPAGAQVQIEVARHDRPAGIWRYAS